MNFCQVCGFDLRAFNSPNYCPECGGQIGIENGPPRIEHEKQSDPMLVPHDEVMGESIGIDEAISRFFQRYASPDGTFPVGVVIRLSKNIEASRMWHSESFHKEMSQVGDGAVLPYNLMLDPVALKAGEREIWVDGGKGLVSRAAAITYYWGGKGFGKRWHFSSPLEAGCKERAPSTIRRVTVDEDRMDFGMHFKPDMDSNKFRSVLTDGLRKLGELLSAGIDTSNVQIPPAGEVRSVALFKLGETK